MFARLASLTHSFGCKAPCYPPIAAARVRISKGPRGPTCIEITSGIAAFFSMLPWTDTLVIPLGTSAECVGVRFFDHLFAWRVLATMQQSALARLESRNDACFRPWSLQRKSWAKHRCIIHVDAARPRRISSCRFALAR